MSELPPPKIEFPCDYPIKIMGRQCLEFRATVLEVMTRHAGDIDDALISERISAKGTFIALTVIITATGKEQLEIIFEDLKATGRVQMVL